MIKSHVTPEVWFAQCNEQKQFRAPLGGNCNSDISQSASTPLPHGICTYAKIHGSMSKTATVKMAKTLIDVEEEQDKENVGPFKPT